MTGRAPFVGNPAQVISSIASDTPPPVNEFAKAVPKPLVRLIAQTLEKDPDRRPLNLNMLRDGLLPFSTRGAVTADLGSRMGAFFIDLFFATILCMLPNFVIILGFMAWSITSGIQFNPQIVSVVAVVPLLIAYFAVSEHLWGRTFGKWLLGLRVVDNDLELPGWFAAIVRSLFIPGFTTVCSSVASNALMIGFEMGDLFDTMAVVSMAQAIGLVFYVPLLIFFIPARKVNGYQGLHGLLSGTRVVRISGDLMSKTISKFAVTAPQLAENAKEMEQFEIIGEFSGESQTGHRVFLGNDRELQRPVWIFDLKDQDRLTAERRNLLRANRLRIINEATAEDQSWYATESVPGLPLADLMDQTDFEWKMFYPMIRDIAFELKCSTSGEMLPANFSIDHVWLDHTGHVRILDHVVTPSQFSDQFKSSAENGKEVSPSVVIQHILDLFMQRHSYPVEVIDFRKELATPAR